MSNTVILIQKMHVALDTSKGRRKREDHGGSIQIDLDHAAIIRNPASISNDMPNTYCSMRQQLCIISHL